MPPFNGSGTFVRVHDWTTDEGNGVAIQASRVDAETDGIATGLSQVLVRDGQAPMTGALDMNGQQITLDEDADTKLILSTDDVIRIDVGGTTELAKLTTSGLEVKGTVVDDGATHDGDVTLTGASYNVVWDKSDNALEFADNAKATFGTGGDLSIYHDGSNSYINDAATGNLKLAASQVDILGGTDGAETMATFVDNGAATLYHDNSAKLATAAGGVTVTGGVYLGGTGSANLLDDFEIGDWTPDIRQSGTAVSDAAYNTGFTSGQYTKVGRLVSASASLRLTSKGTVTSSSTFQIGGLPFASSNNVKARAAASVYNHSGGVVDTSGNKNGSLMGILTHNADEITLAVIDPSDGSSESVQMADVPDDLYLQISLAYITG
jgi:hypothetical protein